MSARVAVIICNYNKRDYLLRCIQSVLESSCRDFDLYVVDNHSSDGSPDAVVSAYGTRCTLIRNDVNKGGAGGFNAGLRATLDRRYEYVYLLDNDVVLDPDAMQELVDYLDRNPQTAAAGSKLYVLEHPDQIQEMGADIDWEKFHVKPHFKGSMDHASLPDVMFCDYVPACSVMARTGVLREVGLMDEQFFIYWDDIEWFYRMRLRGYQIAALGRSKVWHKMGAADRTTTFPTYYFWRNKIHFFSKYLEEQRLPHFAERLTRDIFNAVFFSSYKGQWKTVQTVLMAVNDALKRIRGKAPEARIMEREPQQSVLESIVGSRDRIAIIDCANLKVLRDIVNRFSAINPDASIALVAREQDRAVLTEQFESYTILPDVPKDSQWFICQAVEHVLDVRNRLSQQVDLYVDPYWNTIHSEQDIRMMQSYEPAFEAYDKIYRPVLEAGLRDLRKELETEAIPR